MSFLDYNPPPGTRDLTSEKELPILSKTNSGASMDVSFSSNSFYDEMLFYSGLKKTAFDNYCKSLRIVSGIKPRNAKNQKLISDLNL